MHNRIYSTLDKLPQTLDAYSLQALTCFTAGIVNAQFILAGIEELNKSKEKPLDMLAFIHLNYQNLGSCVESIPHEIRDMFSRELEPIFGLNTSGGTKSWITRSACAHFKTFEELSLNHTKEVQATMVREARAALQAMEGAVRNFSKSGNAVPGALINEIIAKVEPKMLADFLRSPKTAPVVAGLTRTKVKENLFQNCVTVLDVCMGALPTIQEFQGSLPAQALSILTLQFIGENISSLMREGTNVGELRGLRDRRNQTAHQLHMFEQGAVEPDVLFREVHNLSEQYMGVFKEKAVIGKPVEAMASVQSSSQKAQTVDTDFNLSKGVPSQRLTSLKEAFKNEVVKRLTENGVYASAIPLIQKIPADQWNRQLICELMFVLVSSSITTSKITYKLANVITYDIEICKFVLDNLALFTNETIRQFLNCPLKLTLTNSKKGIYSLQDYIFAPPTMTSKNDKVLPGEKSRYVHFLLFAQGESSQDMFEFLLGYGARPNIIIRRQEGAFSLFASCISQGHVKCGVKLIEYGYKVERWIDGSDSAVYIFKHTSPSTDVIIAMILNSDKRLLSEYFSNFWFELFNSGYLNEKRLRENLGSIITVAQKLITHLCSKFSPEYALKFFDSTLIVNRGAEVIKGVAKVIRKGVKVRKRQINIVRSDFMIGCYQNNLDEIANVFRVFRGVLSQYDQYPLHYSVLLDEDITDYLLSTLNKKIIHDTRLEPTFSEDEWYRDNAKLDWPTWINFAKGIKNLRAYNQLCAYLGGRTQMIGGNEKQFIYLFLASLVPYNALNFNKVRTDIPYLILEYYADGSIGAEAPAPQTESSAIQRAIDTVKPVSSSLVEPALYASSSMSSSGGAEGLRAAEVTMPAGRQTQMRKNMCQRVWELLQ